MMQERDEKGLQRRVREGDSQGFFCLYERHGRDVLGILLRLTRGDRAEAEDLTQETFLAAFQGRKAFSGRVPAPRVAGGNRRAPLARWTASSTP